MSRAVERNGNCWSSAVLVHAQHEGAPHEQGSGTRRVVAEHDGIATEIGSLIMITRVAANDMFMCPSGDSLKCGEQGMNIPNGHVGPVLLSDTGRTVWWTGRVAIGLRYRAPRSADTTSQSALWIQDVMLRCA
jgi:hypothetical protein